MVTGDSLAFNALSRPKIWWDFDRRRFRLLKQDLMSLPESEAHVG